MKKIAFVLLLGWGCGRTATEHPPEPPIADPAVVRNGPAVVDGPMVVRGPDGKVLMEGPMRRGQRHGVWTSYHPDGAVRSKGAYTDGVLNGVSVVFHPNGQLYYTGAYRDDHEVGEWRFYDESGELVKAVHYDSTGTIINDR
jgi:antitoxin component YwqK of YwqJK toxin-antitoxin module